VEGAQPGRGCDIVEAYALREVQTNECDRTLQPAPGKPASVADPAFGVRRRRQEEIYTAHS
jgi:hypothetical protein